MLKCTSSKKGLCQFVPRFSTTTSTIPIVSNYRTFSASLLRFFAFPNETNMFLKRPTRPKSWIKGVLHVNFSRGYYVSILSKILKIWWTIMDCYLVDIKWLSEAFGGEIFWYFNIKPADGAAILPVLGRVGKVGIYINEQN